MAHREQPGDWRQFVMDANSGRAATSLTPAPLMETVAPSPLPAAFPGPPQHDVLELLPPRAQGRLRQLRQRKDDAHRLIPEFETVRLASLARVGAQNAVKRLVDHPQNFGKGLPETDPLVLEAQRNLDKLAADFARLQELQAVRSAAFQSASGALANVEVWLRDGRPHGTVLEDYDGPEPKLTKGEAGWLDAIENRRRRCRELRADIHRVRSACYTQAEAMALVSATVENWGSNGIDTSATIEHLSQPTFPTKTVQAMVHNVPGAPGAVVFVEVPDVAAILSTVLKDQFIAWLAADVDRNADPKGALSHEARQQQEAELMGDLLDAERQECALTWQAMEQGLPIEFRSDIPPLAILGIELRTTPRASETPETSPGFSWPWKR